MLKINRTFKVIKKGVVEIIEEKELIERLEKGGQTGGALRIKCGFDPTAPDLHLGHYVLLRKLRQFQELGHIVLFLIGDFTGMIGDPSGQSVTRKALTKEEVKRNARTYEEQVFKVLDIKKTQIVFNSEWLGTLAPDEIVRLSAKYTVARMLEREDFKNRFSSNKPISIHEFLYPLFQAYDSVVLKADVEVGGADQKFNFLLTREIQREFGQPPEVIITLPLLEGTDGVRKMSKSYGNYIGIQEPPNSMFGKIMSISDELMFKYLLLLTDREEEEIEEIKNRVKAGCINPRDVKIEFAFEITSIFHGKEKAEEAREEFKRVFSKKGIPKDMPCYNIKLSDDGLWIPKLLKECGILKSTSEGVRMAKQGGIDVNGRRVDEKFNINEEGEYIVRVGKKKFVKLVIK